MEEKKQQGFESVSVHRAPSRSGSVVVVRCTKTSQRGDRVNRTAGGRCAGEKQFKGFQSGDDLEEIALRLFYSITEKLTENRNLKC